MDYGKIISLIIAALGSNQVAVTNIIRAILAAVGQMLPLLGIKDSGMDVAWVQRALTKLGYNPGKVDGLIGPMTRLAVIEFQKANDLTPDGWLGTETQTKLKMLAPDA